jgi:catechol 2,3-dioxygenase-like lactoylglutathione lyase family enzyme
MSTTEAQIATPDASVGKVDMNLEVYVIPVSDVDRSKQFYERLGWRLDDDAAPLDSTNALPVGVAARFTDNAKRSSNPSSPKPRSPAAPTPSKAAA